MDMEAGTQNNQPEDNLEEDLNEFLNGDNDSDETDNEEDIAGEDDDLFLDDDSDGDESDDDEDSDLEDDNDDSEGNVDGKAEEKPDKEDEPKPGDKETEGAKDTPSSEYASVDDELKARLNPEFIPGSKEFFKATAEDAKAAIIKELGSFDEYDPEHIARYNFYVSESIDMRKRECAAAISIVKKEWTDREAANKAKKQFAEKEKEITSQLDSIFTTPELKQKFGSALKELSEKGRGQYLVILEDLNKGNPAKLLEFAKKVAGVHGRLLDNKPATTRTSPTRTSPKKEGEVFGSDILGF